MKQDWFEIVKFEDEIFYVRMDGLIKLAAVPLCFQPKWMDPSLAILEKIRFGRIIADGLPVKDLAYHDRNITICRPGFSEAA